MKPHGTQPGQYALLDKDWDLSVESLTTLTRVLM